MANPLTGDFEAVLQVSGSTVNRLLATIHQNGGSNTTLPSFPHRGRLRIGEPHPIDGMRGTIAFQAGAPHIDLIHGATDRFWLALSVRARYTADPGSVPIPEFIHGTIRAQYRIDPIDPSCWGWHQIAAEYLWIRVIPDTVSFTGTAEDDPNDFAIIVQPMDPGVADSRITHLARVLLATRFEATPHKVSRRFRHGSMRSLQVSANRSVVAMPIALAGDPPPGRVDSINQDILDGRHLGIAISRDFIVGRIQHELDALKASFVTSLRLRHRTAFVGVKVLEITIDWTVRLTHASVQWLGGIPPMFGVAVPGGVIAVTLKGQARTSRAEFNLDFEVTQFVSLSFDGASEQFTAAPLGAAGVKVFGTFAAVAEPYARPRIQAEVASQVQAAIGGIAASLTLADRKSELITQLQTIDEQADAWFDEAVFTADGVSVRGHIALSPRRPPAPSFSRDQEEYTALDSWIPGGQIDSFAWSWTWFNNAGASGSDTRSDRFVLRRPPASGRGKFGIKLGVHHPLPGLDGMGQVCLAIRGRHVHPVTGDLVPISARRRCKRFGFDISLGRPERIFVRERAPGPRDPIGPVAEAAIHEVGGPHATPHGANTLVVRVGREWNADVAEALRDGLASSHRRDAGLVVLVLFPDGALERGDADRQRSFEALMAELEAPLIVNEDVRGSWSKALGLADAEAGGDGLEWRLVSPTGGVTWAHRGGLAARQLASGLDHYLFPSPPPELTSPIPALAEGDRVPASAIHGGLIDHLMEMESRCPPPPVGRFGLSTVVAFVSNGSAAVEASLREAAHPPGSADTFRVVIVDGAQRRDVDELSRSLPEGTLAIPDPDGALSRRFGIRVWPSVLTLNEAGVVTGFDVGHDNPVRPPREGEAS